MLEKPDLRDEKIIACLRDTYGVPVIQVTFLPLGADQNTAVYRAIAADETVYFVKLRQGSFAEIVVQLPKFLSDQSVDHIIAPLVTKNGQLWADLDTFKVILYPFVDGQNGYEIDLSDRHWIALGAAVKGLHTAVVPSALLRSIPHETYSAQWRDSVKKSMARVEVDTWHDQAAIESASFLKAKRGVILDLVRRAERLAQALQLRPPERVVCHSDLHAGNILVDTKGALYIVDWDNPILAPKERDLMFAGGGQFGPRRTPREEELLFYRGYGSTPIDSRALAYYRYERIIEDIAIYGEQLLLTEEGGADRSQALQYLVSNFVPNGTIEIAYKSDKTRHLPGSG